MTTPLAAAISHCFRRNGLYALRLVEGLSADQWLAQPVPGRVMNHPSWILSHLNVYNDFGTCLAQGVPYEDPAGHAHGKNSRPLADVAAYEPPEQLAARYIAIHDQALAALGDATETLLASPNPLERKRAEHPTVGDMLLMLLVKHESVHLGQLSAWRRAMGLPPAAM